MKIFSNTWSKCLSAFLYPMQFKKFGSKSILLSPLKINGRQNIEIGESVYIQYKTWLGCAPLTGESAPLLRIGSKSVIGHFNHIFATNSIIIEDSVLTADKVFISDNTHSYEDISIPILKQPIVKTKPVVIGEGSWLGENVCVMGASVGKHCIIGANSVVTKNIPDYCVAVGSPAKVIRKYNFQTGEWGRVYTQK